MKIAISILIILILALSILLLLRKSPETPEAGIEITQEQKIYKLTLDRISKKEATKFSTKMGNELSGYFLKEILTSSGFASDSFRNIKFVALDGFHLTVKKSELNDCYLVMMPSKNDFKIVFAKDEHPQRWLKFLNKIELTN